MRNTRIGFAFQSPAVGDLRPSALIEGDFFGSQPSPPTGVRRTPTSTARRSGSATPTSSWTAASSTCWPGRPTTCSAGRTTSSRCSAEFLGLPNQVFSRNTQLRLSRTFGAARSRSASTSPRRPAAPRSAIRQVPDVRAACASASTAGRGSPRLATCARCAAPLSIGVSGVVRPVQGQRLHCRRPTQSSNSVSGWGLSVDALFRSSRPPTPTIAGNALTLTGSFVIGTGIADLLTTGGGATFRTLPNPDAAVAAAPVRRPTSTTAW